MKRILFIRSNTKRTKGGIVRYCDALYDMFAGDHDCSAMEIEELPLKASKVFHNYISWKDIRKEVNKADVIHINGYTEMTTVQAIIAAKACGKKVVYTAHWHPFKHLRHPIKGMLFFYVFLFLTIKFLVDDIITINNEDTSFFLRFHKRVHKIPHWPSIKETDIRTQSKQKDLILFVGRLNDPVKGFEHLYHLPTNRYNIHCIGAGEIVPREDIHTHTNISDSELSELYSKAALVVVPSRYEAFSYVALEALQHGTPVVLSDRVHIADYLQKVNGVGIFEYGDFKAFEKCVENTIGQQVDSKKVSDIFSADRIREKYKAIYLS